MATYDVAVAGVDDSRAYSSFLAKAAKKFGSVSFAAAVVAAVELEYSAGW